MNPVINPLSIVIGCGMLISVSLIGSRNEPNLTNLKGTVFQEIKVTGYEDKSPKEESTLAINVEGINESTTTNKPALIAPLQKVNISIDADVRKSLSLKSESFIAILDEGAPLIIRSREQEKRSAAKQNALIKKISKVKTEPPQKSKKVDEEKESKNEDESEKAIVKHKASIYTSLLDQIRTDPKRIYADTEVISNDLRFGVLNVSPKLGLEVYVENVGTSNQNYYLPKVKAGGVEGKFEGRYIAPGTKYFGVVPLANLGTATSVDVVFSASPGSEKKTTIKFAW